MSKKTILICSDEIGIRESLKLILQDDYDVALSSDKQECLNLLKGRDLLIIGIRRDDLDVIKKIKEINPLMEIILILSYKDADVEKLSNMAYVVKPFSSREIRKIVERSLNEFCSAT